MRRDGHVLRGQGFEVHQECHKDHTHDPADAIEHFISAELAVELGVEVGDERDPQGKQIPPSSA